MVVVAGIAETRPCVLVTTVCQYEVLKYLSFAVSTLAKCAKIIPVMIWGRIILRKRYTLMDFVSAGAVTAGCFIFVLDRGGLRGGEGIVRGVRVTTDATPQGIATAAPGPTPGSGPGKEVVGEYNKGSGGGGGGGNGGTHGNHHSHHLVEELDEIVTHPFNVWFEGIKPHSELHQYVLGSVIMLVYLGFDGEEGGEGGRGDTTAQARTPHRIKRDSFN